MSTFDLQDISTCRSAGSGFETIHEVIDGIAMSRPDATFLLSPETADILTFGSLQQQARSLTCKLQQLGLTFGDKVAFLMDNGLSTAQLFLGLMYGGFVAVPLNVGAGISQLSYTLDHSDAKVIYVSEEYRALVETVMTNVPRCIHLIFADPDTSSAPSETLNISTKLMVPRPEDPALLMYTSGSTGQPRAAVHSHSTVLAHGRNSISAHQLTSADRSLLVLPLYHINAECVTLVPTLMSGGSVVVPRRFSVSQFWDWLDEYRCTWSALVPTIISQLLDRRDPRADSREAAFERIRFLRSSSAPLAPSLHREFLEKFKVLLIQAMGSSEAGNVFSNPLPPGENKIGSVGLPWGVETKIINREGVEVTPGEPGEVLLRGAALAQGYYKDHEATAAVFDPEGWLHTGDLAYRDGDGYFFVVGRSKELIIKGGVNIAPRQIDEVLESHPGVLEAAAIGVPDRYLGEDLVAFVVLRAGVTGDERELLTFCEGRLGHFKTPTRIRFVSDLPKGPSGKVQRLRLKDAAHSAIDWPSSSESESELVHGNGHLPPQNGLLPTTLSIEQVIAESWAEVLSQPRIDFDRSFFELGGHSLLAVQCSSRLREKIPVALSLSDFFENGTVTQLAALVRRRLQADGWVQAQPASGKSVGTFAQGSQGKAAPPVGLTIPLRDPALPCSLSDAQRRLWFIEQLNPELPLYNEAEAVRLGGELKIDAMERALNVIVARHEALRTTIQVTDNQPMMVVHASWPLRVKRIDLSGLDPGKQQAELERLLIDEPRRPYHLETEPGIRATLLCLAPRNHVFILMMHHLISDRSSFGIVWREMAALYRAFCRGESFALPTSPIQYGDYIVWQQQQTSERGSADDLSFWGENLRGAPQILELPLDRPRPATLSYRGAKQRFKLDPELSGGLRALSKREQTSLFTLFAAALNTLLYRYTGQEDILVGIPIADRERPELRSVIGFLVDTHVLRTQLSEDITFRELLARVRKGMLDVYRHRAVPFDQVVRNLQRDRRLGYSSLFQVMINWRDRDLQLPFIGLEGLVVEPLLAESRTSKNDMTLFVTDGLDEIHLEIEYNTGLFEADRIRRMSAHLRVVLEGIVRDPAQRLSQLPLLTAEDRREQLVEWNRTERAYPRESSLAALVEAQVERTPDALAIVFEDSSITYRGLNEWANQLAHQLRKHGAGPDQLVGVCLERSVGMIAALLAIVKAGAAYVPLDPDLPPGRLGYMIEDSGMQILLTQQELPSSLSAFAGTIIKVDGGEWQSNSRENPSVAVTPENLAYVIYTSGSTGKPKGVPIRRQALTNILWSMKEWLKLGTGQATLATTTISFDIAGLEVWLPLLVGGRVVVVSRETAVNGEELAVIMKQQDIRLAQATPVTWRLLLSSGWSGKFDLVAICGGEAMPQEVAAQLRPLVGRLWNFYGPTETTIWSTGFLVEKGNEPVLIGRPVANTQCYILDDQRQPVPVGVVGELYIGGDGLARGYLNRPELTEEKFVPNPFVPGKRMYRTGDLARYRADGNIECLGRTDHQVKLRGYRIELGEIESVLESHPGVRQCIVVAREDRPGDTQLVAYVVPSGMAVPDRGELRALLKQNLPDYMVPGDYVVLDSIPVTPNGKVDRLALPAPLPSASLDDASYLAPQDAYEELICKAWADVLGLKRVGIRDNFFDLGGHSLLAVQLMLRLQEIIPGEPLPLRAVLEAPTVERFAAWLRNHKANERQLLVRIRPGTSERPPFFSVHGAGVYVLDMRALAMALPADLPFYCFEDKGLDGSTPFESIEEAARCYIDEIRQVQPHGPYYLGGACYGGIVAFEMARKLEELGEPVAALVLIDTLNPAHVRSLSKRQRLSRNIRFYTRRTAWHARRILTQPPGEWLGYISGPLKHFRDGMLNPAKASAILDEERVSYIPSNPIGEILKRIMRANLSAARKFLPRPYNGSALIFRAGDRFLRQYDDYCLGWESVVRGGIECVEIEGCGHESILCQPAVQLVAEKLDAKFMELSGRDRETCSSRS